MCGLSIASVQKTTSISFFSWYVYQTTICLKSFYERNAYICLKLSLIGACKIMGMEIHNFKMDGFDPVIYLFVAARVVRK